jgi:decaprenyl-phosphate phosphoribosyltransferase
MNPATGSAGQSSVLLGMIRLMRPQQWIKNGFVLAPLVFSGEFTDRASIVDALLATLLFCFASSAVYIVNDYHDIEQDRLHPEKSRIARSRPGRYPEHALGLLLLPMAVLVWGYFLQPGVTGVIVLYLILNLAYTFHLKHQPVICLFAIAVGFVLRVYAGATRSRFRYRPGCS